VDKLQARWCWYLKSLELDLYYRGKFIACSFVIAVLALPPDVEPADLSACRVLETLVLKAKGIASVRAMAVTLVSVCSDSLHSVRTLIQTWDVVGDNAALQ
jgi:hypothetical protein